MPPAEDVKRQIAITVLITVNEPPLWISVHRIIRRIKVEDDFVRCSLVRLQEKIDQQSLDGDRIVTDLVNSVSARACSAPAGSTSTCRRPARSPPGAPRACRPAPPSSDHGLVVIVEVFVAERNREHALVDQRHHLILNQMRLPLAMEVRRKSLHHADRPIRRTQQKCAGHPR